MQKKTTNFKIGEIATTQIGIPLIKINSGRPRVLLLAGVHGKEISGLFVIKRLLEDLEITKGQLTILPAANPVAQALKTRETPLDLTDLNRSFPGDMKAGFTARMANVIFGLAQKCDLVVDLHTFEDPSSVVAIFMNHGGKAVKQRSLQAIKIFQPDIIWQLSTKKGQEKRLGGSLGPHLAEAGVPNFAVEMPEHFRIKDTQLEQVTEGLLNIFAWLGMLDQKLATKTRKIPIYERQQVFSDLSGLFIPRKGLLEEVKKGEVVGKIVSVRNFTERNIKSTFSGRLIVLKDKDFVRTGDVLFTVGKKVRAV